jgi:hypothetical protein
MSAAAFTARQRQENQEQAQAEHRKVGGGVQEAAGRGAVTLHAGVRLAGSRADASLLGCGAQSKKKIDTQSLVVSALDKDVRQFIAALKVRHGP